MAYLEIETSEIAELANKLNNKENISNFKGIPEGISFTIEQKVLMKNMLIPMKIVFSKLEDSKIVFEITPTGENKVAEIGFNLIKNHISKFITLRDGLELINNYLYVTPTKITKQNIFEVNVSEASIELGKLRLSFNVL